MPLENGPVHVECSTMRNFMASSTEAELGGLFENFQKENSMRTALAEIGHQQTPTPVTNDNTSANSIVKGTAKQKRFRAIDMIFYWVKDRILQNYFYVSWEEGKKNLADYVTKQHPIWNDRARITIYVKATKKIWRLEH